MAAALPHARAPPRASSGLPPLVHPRTSLVNPTHKWQQCARVASLPAAVPEREAGAALAAALSSAAPCITPPVPAVAWVQRVLEPATSGASLYDEDPAVEVDLVGRARHLGASAASPAQRCPTFLARVLGGQASVPHAPCPMPIPSTFNKLESWLQSSSQGARLRRRTLHYLLLSDRLSAATCRCRCRCRRGHGVAAELQQ